MPWTLRVKRYSPSIFCFTSALVFSYVLITVLDFELCPDIVSSGRINISPRRCTHLTLSCRHRRWIRPSTDEGASRRCPRPPPSLPAAMGGRTQTIRRLYSSLQTHSKLTIGIRREDPQRIWERRCPLTPEAVSELVEKEGVRVLVQPCERRVWTGDELLQVSAHNLLEVNATILTKNILRPVLKLTQRCRQPTSSLESRKLR